MADLYAINLSEEMSETDFKKEVAIKFRTGPRNKNIHNKILAVSPRVHHLLTKNDRVYIKYESLRVKDFIKVTWCAKCNDLGHSAKKCFRDEVCHNCGKKGHTKNNCKEEAIGCMPCKYRNGTCNKAGRRECPTHKQLYTRQVENTDYDYQGNGQ